MCGELADKLDMKPQAVSNQLQRLADRGIVEAQREDCGCATPFLTHACSPFCIKPGALRKTHREEFSTTPRQWHHEGSAAWLLLKRLHNSIEAKLSAARAAGFGSSYGGRMSKPLGGDTKAIVAILKRLGLGLTDYQVLLDFDGALECLPRPRQQGLSLDGSIAPAYSG